MMHFSLKAKVPFWLLAGAFFCSAIAGYGKQEDIIDNQDSLMAYLSKEKFSIDTNAQAVILYEKGSALLSEEDNLPSNRRRWTPAYRMQKFTPDHASNVLTYTVDKTIKILSAEAAMGVGMVAIPASEDVTIKRVSGMTYNLEDGKIVSQKLEKADIQRDHITDEVKALKFNLPSLKAGSILHYSYTLEYYTFSGVPAWEFQHHFPTLFSEYQTSVPAAFNLTDLSRTSIPFVNVDKEKDLDSQAAGKFKVEHGNTANANTTWVRRRIPALKTEPFRMGDDNYEERVKLRYLNWNWEQVTGKLYANPYTFSRAFAPNVFLKDKVRELTKDKATDLEKAKAVFDYVRDNYVLDNSGHSYAIHLQTVFNKQRGSLREINILLTAMLRKAGLNSEPVILSTKPNEPLSMLYPDVEDVNYLISSVKIGAQQYFLDASEKYLSFGMLLPECYNGYARAINAKGYPVNLSAENLKEQGITLAQLNLDTTGGMTLHLQMDEKMEGIVAFQKRSNWHGDMSRAKKDLKSSLDSRNFNVTNLSIENIANPDAPLKIHIEAEEPLPENNGMIYLSPYFSRFFEHNPFAAIDRTFPVSLDYAYNMSYILSFKYPGGYKIVDYPKSETLASQDGSIVFENLMMTDTTKNNFTLRNQFTTYVTEFKVSAYPVLRTFFEQMIADQNKKIVLKKIN